jgi:hypothetical protein
MSLFDRIMSLTECHGKLPPTQTKLGGLGSVSIHSQSGGCTPVTSTANCPITERHVYRRLPLEFPSTEPTHFPTTLSFALALCSHLHSNLKSCGNQSCWGVTTPFKFCTFPRSSAPRKHVQTPVHLDPTPGRKIKLLYTTSGLCMQCKI